MIYFIFKHAAAYVPDTQQSCEINAEAICLKNKIELRTAGPCPVGYQTVRPFKVVDCKQPNLNKSANLHILNSNTPINQQHSFILDFKNYQFASFFSIIIGLIILFYVIKKYIHFNKKLLIQVIFFSISLIVGLWVGKQAYLHTQTFIKNQDSLAGAIIGGPIALVFLVSSYALTFFLLNYFLKKVISRR